MSRPVVLEPGLGCLRAPNPSPMTERGTNTYLLGLDEVTVVDPGPAIPAHLDAILRAAGRGRVVRILVTHAHLDHSASARELSDRTGAPVLAFGDARAGRSPRMAGLTGLGGGEGVDGDFRPDAMLKDGESIDTEVGPVTAIWTPGHFGNHLSFAWNGAILCGDLVMGWASTLVSPPDGDLTDFLTSCARLRDLEPRVLYPGHGTAVLDPVARIDWLIDHRREREIQILDALAAGPCSPIELADAVYVDTPTVLKPAAVRNVLAHLIDLAHKRRVTALGNPGMSTPFERT